MTNNRPLRVFLCHSSNDKPIVRKLYNQLILRGIDAWLDEMKLLPGQQWMLEIPKAVREADAVIICLSKSSITKEGYVQREIKFALDIALEKPEGTIYLIPAKIDECEVPYSLREWQWVNLFEPNGSDLLFRSLQTRANSLGLSTGISMPASMPGATIFSPSREEKEPVNKIPKLNKSVGAAKNLTLSNGMEFTCVPAGDFIMGCSSNQEDKEKPQHTVDIPYDYWMARFPVTNMMYSLYTAAHRIKHPIDGWENKKNHPVAKNQMGVFQMS